jgi:carbamoyl-phosphate synthase large subunit
MLGHPPDTVSNGLEVDHVGVKVPQFSFGRLAGADPFLGVEMASTGEVACLGADLDEALLKAMWSVGIRPPRRGVLLSLGKLPDKYRFRDEARTLTRMGLTLFATSGTAQMLTEEGLAHEVVARSAEEPGPIARGVIESGRVDLVVNIPRSFDAEGRPDGYEIRRAAVDRGVPLITDVHVARLFVRAVARQRAMPMPVRSWGSYLRAESRTTR